LKRVGILGLPSSGKSTLFEILMQGAGATGGSAGGSSGREQLGVVRVPDERVDRLTALFQPKKTAYAQIQFVDTVAAGHGGKPGKGADLFSSVRNCDALLAVVRDFASEVAPAEGGVDPARDLRRLDDELILNDLAIVETRMERIEKELRIGKRQSEPEHAVLAVCRTALEAGRPLRGEALDERQSTMLRGFQLLTRKPLIVVYNQDELSTRAPADPGPAALAIQLRALLEREIVTLPAGERDSYRGELGVEQDGLSLVIRACYDLLGLISFFTVGPDEVRAWTLSRGDTAVDAAGEIHTDLARGFIRAEVSSWEALLEHGGIAGARAKGLLRLEGREYVVRDGDCLEIRFNRT
jgi:GTP-binding protein YchF